LSASSVAKFTAVLFVGDFGASSGPSLCGEARQDRIGLLTVLFLTGLSSSEGANAAIARSARLAVGELEVSGALGG